MVSELDFLNQTKQLIEVNMALLQYQHKEICAKIAKAQSEDKKEDKREDKVAEALGGPNLELK